VRNNGTVTATLTPAQDVSGTNNLKVTVRRTTDGASTFVVIPMSVTPVNDIPVISRLTAKMTVEDKPVTFDILVTDVDTSLANLRVRVTSSDQSVISSTNAVLNNLTNDLKGIPASLLSLTLRPNTDAVGTAEITVDVFEGTATTPSATSSLTFTVIDQNDPPTITSIPNINVSSGGSTTNIAFTVFDPENTTLTITATSSDQTAVANSSFIISQPTGLSGPRTISFKGVEGLTANKTATITVKVTDAGGVSAETTFVATVRPTRERIFANTQPIEIRDNNTANPYPSQITVSDLVANVTKITVSINGLTHRFASDIDMLLVGPAGQKVVLMSDAGGGPITVNNTPTHVNLKFDASAADPLPQGGPLVSGTYRPANYDGSSDVFPSPAPAGPYSSTALADFNGAAPNGVWSLYIVDDEGSDSGVITNGWTLNVTTEPILVGLQNQTIVEDTQSRQNFTVVEENFASADFTFTASSSNPTLVPNNAIVVTGSGSNFTVTVTPALNQSGTATITLNLSNPDGQTVTRAFTLTVTPLNDPPVVTPILDQTLAAGQVSAPITFNFSDAETAKKDLILAVTSSNPSLIPTNNISVIGNELRIITQGNATGQSTITLTVTDPQGLATTSQFIVTVTPALNPLFANTGAIEIKNDSTAVPYPSVINVAGLSGTVVKVTVTLADLTHPFPDDIDMLLVGPKGQKVVLIATPVAVELAML
jgi:subtilisin-like proprotein convertase family protein